MAKAKIGVYGSAISESPELDAKAGELGGILAEHDIILITGACPGLPYKIASAAYEKSRPEIWGFSPAKDYDGQLAFTPHDDSAIYARLIYIPADAGFVDKPDVCKKYRNVLSTAACDAGIVMSGRWGSLNEFTNLYDMGKIIGVLTGTGGIADELVELDKKIHKPSKAKIIFDSSPRRLVERVLEEVRGRMQ